MNGYLLLVKEFPMVSEAFLENFKQVFGLPIAGSVVATRAEMGHENG